MAVFPYGTVDTKGPSITVRLIFASGTDCIKAISEISYSSGNGGIPNFEFITLVPA